MYFVTCCTTNRQPCLADENAHSAIRHAWSRLSDWRVGRYVVMPDHVHFFVSPSYRDGDLSKYMQAFRSLVTRQLRPLGFPYPLWQREFFDHLLRSGESYEAKWQYVWLNPFAMHLSTALRIGDSVARSIVWNYNVVVAAKHFRGTVFVA